jgi:hypothetical protein
MAHGCEIFRSLCGVFSEHGDNSAMVISSVLVSIVAGKKIRAAHAAFFVGRQRK